MEQNEARPGVSKQHNTEGSEKKRKKSKIVGQKKLNLK